MTNADIIKSQSTKKRGHSSPYIPIAKARGFAAKLVKRSLNPYNDYIKPNFICQPQIYLSR